MSKLLFVLTLTVTQLVILSAQATPLCTVESDKGDICRVPIDMVRPTQFAVGLREVKQKQRFLESLEGKDLTKYLKDSDNLAEVIIGPGGNFYLTDGHHLAVALYRMKATVLYVQIEKNWSDHSNEHFWKKMIGPKGPEEAEFCYLYDEFGKGPHRPEELPSSLEQLKDHDDPYRSLAREVRKRGGYKKTDVLYAEFQWANFFRSRIPVGKSDDEFETAVKAAVEIAHSPEAKDLPGYNGNT